VTSDLRTVNQPQAHARVKNNLALLTMIALADIQGEVIKVHEY